MAASWQIYIIYQKSQKIKVPPIQIFYESNQHKILNTKNGMVNNNFVVHLMEWEVGPLGANVYASK